ncbi:hypothetical protein RirG_146750 [Rhizophagus irregularis DAOM 197198w]|uniref:Uncharacterized protein n=1 Tax=Rhizophagus irregularis (strain DAOM 197198w) TaxID=1432141 RepID=A0A015KVJ1_RHIIW|nr:hypothetical protein RirG_146750 [Rhizophagus irregularis DAOM 197198w]
MSRKSNVTKKQRSPSLAQEISEEFICLSEMNPEPLPGIILFLCLIKYSQGILSGKLLLEPATVLAKNPPQSGRNKMLNH